MNNADVGTGQRGDGGKMMSEKDPLNSHPLSHRQHCSQRDGILLGARGKLVKGSGTHSRREGGEMTINSSGVELRAGGARKEV